MNNYSVGTVSVTNGSCAVTGNGTNLGGKMIEPGDLINIEGGLYELASITGDEALSLTSPYAGATNATAAYFIARTFDQQSPEELAAALTQNSGIQATLTTIPENIEYTLNENEQAVVFGSLTVNGSYTVNGELRVQNWPA